MELLNAGMSAYACLSIQWHYLFIWEPTTVSHQNNISRDLAIEDLERGAFFRINYQM